MSLDPATARAVAENEGRLPFIAPEEFWTDYELQSDGTQKAVEMVRWVKKGMQTPATVVEKVSRMSKTGPQGQHSPEWTVLKPYYDNWKKGEAAPVNGTPLAAWPGATPQLVKALTPANIRSVEDLAEMEDSAIQRLAIPGLRDKQKQARAFLEAAKTTAVVSGEVVKLRDALESRDREIAELKDLIEKHVIKKEQEGEEPRRKPGRPRKVA